MDPAAADRMERLLAHREWVRRVARALVLDESRAEDLEQETWLRALSSPEPLFPRGWLATLLRNGASNLRIAEGRRSRHEQATPPREPPPTPGDLLERAEVVERVARAVRELEEPYRTAILLRYFEDLPPAAIAGRLSVPIETVRTRLRRARVHLRERLDRDEGDGRRRWALLLLPLARRSEPAGAGVATAAGTAGVLLVTLKTKAAIAAGAILLLGGAAWWTRPGDGAAAPPAEAHGARSGGSAANPPPPRAPERPVPIPPVADEGPSATGRVLDPEGRPVGGARVVAFPEFEAPARIDGPVALLSAEAAADGSFRVGLPPVAPTFRLLAEAPGFAPGGSAAVRPGAEVVLVLGRTLALAGRVLDGEGKSVPGARVRFLGSLPGGLLRRSAVADGEGAYRIEGIPDSAAARALGLREETALLAEAPGFAPLTVRWFPDGRPEPHVDLHLVRGAVLEGRVVEGGSGNPVPGARVLLWTFERAGDGGEAPDGLAPLSSGGGPRSLLGETVSDGEGGFRFESMPAAGVHPLETFASGRRGPLLGLVGAMAMAEGWCPGSEEVPVPQDGARVEARIVLWRAASIRGRVLDAAGAPVEGAHLSEFTPGRLRGWFPSSVEGAPPPGARSGADGRYLLEGVAALPGGPALAHVRAAHPVHMSLWSDASGEPPSVEVAVAAGEVADAPDLVVPSTTTPAVVLKVRDAEGRPIWGARACWGQFSAEATSDREGRLFFPFTGDRAGVPPGPATLVVRAPGFAPTATAAFTPSVEDPPEVEVLLRPGGSIAGRVRREDGSPVGGARVWVLEESVAEEALFPDRMNTVGLQGPPPEGMPRLVLLGVVSAAADGAFTVADLPGGPFRVRADLGRESTSVEGVLAGRRDLLLSLPSPLPRPRASVRVKVIDAGTGKPLLTSTAMLSRSVPGADGRARGRIEWANAEPGTAADEHRWSGVAAGEWNLTVEAAGFIPLFRTVTVAAEGTVEVEAPLGRGATVRGTLRAGEGVEVRDLWVGFLRVGRTVVTAEGLVDPEDAPRSAPAARDGSFEVRGLAPGTWRAVIRRPAPGEPWYGLAGPTVVEVPAEGGDLLLDLAVLRGGLLTVHVEGEAREYAAGERPILLVEDGEGREVHRGVLRGVGTWEMFPVAPGAVTVKVMVPGRPLRAYRARVDADGRTDLVVE